MDERGQPARPCFCPWLADSCFPHKDHSFSLRSRTGSAVRTRLNSSPSFHMRNNYLNF
jgi:hypothetical protein